MRRITVPFSTTSGPRSTRPPGLADGRALATPGPGAYQFVCTIHDGMAGTLTVEAVAANG